jgi:hypothetical protein
MILKRLIEKNQSFIVSIEKLKITSLLNLLKLLFPQSNLPLGTRTGEPFQVDKLS